MKVTIRQCRDWCCEERPFSERWWNCHLDGLGYYESGPDPTAAYRLLVLRAP